MQHLFEALLSLLLLLRRLTVLLRLFLSLLQLVLQVLERLLVTFQGPVGRVEFFEPLQLFAVAFLLLGIALLALLLLLLQLLLEIPDHLLEPRIELGAGALESRHQEVLFGLLLLTLLLVLVLALVALLLLALVFLGRITLVGVAFLGRDLVVLVLGLVGPIGEVELLLSLGIEQVGGLVEFLVRLLGRFLLLLTQCVEQVLGGEFLQAVLQQVLFLALERLEVLLHRLEVFLEILQRVLGQVGILLQQVLFQVPHGLLEIVAAVALGPGQGVHPLLDRLEVLLDPFGLLVDFRQLGVLLLGSGGLLQFLSELLERIDGGLFEGVFELLDLVGHLRRHQGILFGLLGQRAQVVLDLLGQLDVGIFFGCQGHQFFLQCVELLLFLGIELDRLLLGRFLLVLGVLLGLVVLRLVLLLLVRFELGLLDLLGQFLVVLLEFVRLDLDLFLFRNQFDQLVAECVGLLLELFELLVRGAVVFLDLDHVIDRLAALSVAVPDLDPVGQRIAGLESSVGEVERDIAAVVLEWRAERHNGLAHERLLVTRFHAQQNFLHAEIVERGDEDRHRLRPREDQGLARPLDDHLRRVVGDRHDLRFGHRLVVAVGLVLQLHAVQAVLDQRERTGKVALAFLELFGVGGGGGAFEFKCLPGGQQLDDGFLGRRHRSGIAPDGLSAMEAEHHARDRTACESDGGSGDFQRDHPTRLRQVADAESRRGARLALADQVLAPERPVLPALSVVPLEHDLSRHLVRRQVDGGK